MPNDNGFRDWNAGDFPTGDEFDAYIGEQVIGLYDDETDRDTQLPIPTAVGQRAYARDTGIEYVAIVDPVEDGTLAGHWTWVEFGRVKAWTEYTPTLTVPAGGTDPTLGTGAVQIGRWTLEGTLATVAVYIKLGTSSAAGTGIYEVSLPAECPVAPAWFGAEELIVGNGLIVDASTGQRYAVAVKTVGAGLVRMEADTLTAEVTESNLIAWADGDVVLSATLTYETEEVY